MSASSRQQFDAQAERYEESRGGASTWLVMMGRSRALDRVRSRRRFREESYDEIPETSAVAEQEGPDPLRSALDADVRRLVAAAVAKLPLRYRVPLVLHEIEGWSYVDIAQEIGCREGTVKSRVHRGRQQLKRKLAPYWNGDASWKTTG